MQAYNFFPARPVRAYCSTEYEKPDVRKLAELAQLHLTDEEVQSSFPRICMAIYLRSFLLC